MDNFIAHILVVDDDEGIRSLVKKYLNENNFLVSTADSAESASKKIEIIEFDLIILDIMMPGKSGLEFIKENKKNLETPIILLTAKGEPTERIEGLEIGADDYLPKPFEPKELILRIKNILEKTKKIDQKRVIEFSDIMIDLNKLLISNQKKEYKINNTEKVIHLLSMYEGISISELLKKLKVTKQSLNRVLKDLIKLEIINFKKDDQDTRIKHVFLNDKGKKIFEEIFVVQKKRIYNALLSSSSEEVINFDSVLKEIMNG